MTPAQVWTPGIDVSHYQGAIDWGRVKAAGIQFAYLKATDGISYVDPTFLRNSGNCETLGIPWGAYHFFRPDQDPSSQAIHFLETLAALSPSLPSALDLEISPGETVDLIQEVDDFIAELGESPLIYCSPAFALQWLRLDDDFTTAHPLWVAEYTLKPEPETAPWSDWLFWQHTPGGQVDGIPNQVDLDWFHGTPAEFKTRFGLS